MSKSPKRLLYIDHTPFAGGAQLVLAEHIRELDRQRFDPYLACSDTIPELVARYKAAGAFVITVQFPRLRNLRVGSIGQFVQVVRQVRSIIRDNNIDIVISNTTRASYISTLAVWGTGIPIVWWVRDFLYPRALFRLLQPRTSKIIFVSKAIRDAYVGVNNPKAEVVYVASSLYQHLPQITQAQLATERKKWRIAADDVVVGFMGRLVADKGVEDLVEAARLLQTTGSRVKFVIVGTGKNQMNDVEKKLQETIAAHQLGDMVIMTGYQEDEALYYSLFDIFVLPTRDGEPFATSVVQAMMAGCAVIGSNAGGTPELVEDGVTGLLFTPGEATQLAETIRRLASDSMLKDALADTGKKRVLQYHREEIITDQVEAIFDQVLND